MGIVFLIIVLVYIAVAFFISRIIGKYTSKKKGSLSFCVLLIIPFLRNILVFILFFYYGLFPLSAIHKTVEKPISVYWEDNVYPGFTEEYRKGMVNIFLDGEHLKQLILNGGDGKYYVYTANELDYKDSNKARIVMMQKLAQNIDKYKMDERKHFGLRLNYTAQPEVALYTEKYSEEKEKEDYDVIQRVHIVGNKSEIPPVNYKIEWNLLPKGLFVNNRTLLKLIYADKLNITDIKTNREIAFNIRYAAYVGGIFRSLHYASGNFSKEIYDYNPFMFGYEVLFNYVPIKDYFGGKDIKISEN